MRPRQSGAMARTLLKRAATVKAAAEEPALALSAAEPCPWGGGARSGAFVESRSWKNWATLGAYETERGTSPMGSRLAIAPKRCFVQKARGEARRRQENSPLRVL